MAVWRWIGLAVVLGAGAGYVLTRPAPLSADAIEGLRGDATRGAVIFAAAGCASCHADADEGAEGLGGGHALASDFGTFYAPNISPDPTHGIGAWSDLELASAIVTGVGRDGGHLYPAFPYAAYNKATMRDVVDLIAHLRTLPANPRPNTPHDIGFPFNQRILLGGWKFLFESDDWVLEDAGTEQLARGRYLVEALGHCGECHTPRNALGGLDKGQWMAGAPNPSGEGRIPNITPAALDWSEAGIAEYLKSGFTPSFDTAGGSMAAVVRNTAQLTDLDRAAIAAYLKAIPPVAN